MYRLRGLRVGVPGRSDRLRLRPARGRRPTELVARRAARAPQCARPARGRLSDRCAAIGDLLDEIDRDVLFYEESRGGVTLSGGEPLAQPEFAAELLRECRERRIHTAVDTCGFADEEALAAVAAHTDLFLYDIKLLDDERHRRWTGVSNAAILQNLGASVERAAGDCGFATR